MSVGPAVGGPISMYGDIMSGQMTADSLQAQSKIQQNNAQQAEEAGQYNATRQMMIAGQKIGSSVAAYGAAGVAANSGSVQAVIGASAANAEADRLNILHGADIKAINYNNQASMDNYGAASAVQGSYWKAFGDLTDGAIGGLSNQGGASPQNDEDPENQAGSVGGQDVDMNGGESYYGAGEGAAEGGGLTAGADAAALA